MGYDFFAPFNLKVMELWLLNLEEKGIVLRDLLVGSRIESIRTIRRVSGLGLREAKSIMGYLAHTFN